MMMYKDQVKRKLLAAGVRNLKEFGYSTVNESNILTDYVYSKFFKSMLEENKGKGAPAVDRAIDELLSKIKDK